MIVGIILVDAVWLAVSGIGVELDGFTVAAGGVAVLLLIAAVLGPIKFDPVWRGMTLASAALVAFTIPVTFLHYLRATLALPLPMRCLRGWRRPSASTGRPTSPSCKTTICSPAGWHGPTILPDRRSPSSPPYYDPTSSRDVRFVM
ncbi:hypothetical protein [Methylobacterium trifolii]|uniref:hypothetical protein n=1 Tax=Methylobacterium trifolii TaxID=1003092 RepID=UPI001EDEE1E5|nr:hypothetical protein [Methylobacterium trifolii]